MSDILLLYKELRKIRKLVQEVLAKENLMSAELDALTAQVAETVAVEQSAIVLIQGLAARLEAIANDPAAVLALAAELNAQEVALAEAVATFTPPAVP